MTLNFQRIKETNEVLTGWIIGFLFLIIAMIISEIKSIDVLTLTYLFAFLACIKIIFQVITDYGDEKKNEDN